jgi:fatty acid desaturase
MPRLAQSNRALAIRATIVVAFALVGYAAGEGAFAFGSMALALCIGWAGLYSP